MNKELNQNLTMMAEADQRLLRQLFELGELPSDEYHPKMRALHEGNVAALKEIINEYGWPGLSLVGSEGRDIPDCVSLHPGYSLQRMGCSCLPFEAVDTALTLVN